MKKYHRDSTIETTNGVDWIIIRSDSKNAVSQLRYYVDTNFGMYYKHEYYAILKDTPILLIFTGGTPGVLIHHFSVRFPHFLFHVYTSIWIETKTIIGNFYKNEQLIKDNLVFSIRGKRDNNYLGRVLLDKKQNHIYDGYLLLYSLGSRELSSMLNVLCSFFTLDEIKEMFKEDITENLKNFSII